MRGVAHHYQQMYFPQGTLCTVNRDAAIGIAHHEQDRRLERPQIAVLDLHDVVDVGQLLQGRHVVPPLAREGDTVNYLLPPAKNFIDELVFKKLKEVGMPPSAVCSDETFIRRVTVDVPREAVAASA